MPEYSKVANALGAVVGNISAKVIIEVVLDQKEGAYTVFGRGERHILTNLDEAKALAKKSWQSKRRRKKPLQEVLPAVCR